MINSNLGKDLTGNLLIANRDPTEKDLVNQRFWLNYSTKQLFEYYGQWRSMDGIAIQPDSH